MTTQFKKESINWKDFTSEARSMATGPNANSEMISSMKPFYFPHSQIDTFPTR